MRIFILVVLLSISCNLFGQSFSTCIRGRLVDHENQPIPNVQISCLKHLFYSNDNGDYFIAVNKLNNLKIEFIHSGFLNDSIVIAKPKLAKYSNDTLNLGATQLKNITIPEFTLVANKVDTVFGSKNYSVEDFEITKDGLMVLLAYEKTLKKESKVLLLNQQRQQIHSHLIPGESVRLYKDFASNIYVLGKEKVFAINISEDQYINVKSVNKNEFYNFTFRIIDTIGANFLYSNYNELYPAIKFFSTNLIDSSNLLIKQVKDDFMMELYRAQYKYVSGRDKLWAFRKEQETGIDKEIWIGASVFTKDILYRPIYAPLFVCNDSVFVFDHYNDFIYTFDSTFNAVDSVSINYHQPSKKEKWRQPLIQDEYLEDLFTIFHYGGNSILKKIYVKTGSVSKGFKLSNRYVNKIKVFNGYVYYTYRPFESLQKKFLYKEKIFVAK